MDYALSGLLIAWLLDIFGIGNLLVVGVNDLFHYSLTMPAYYLIFFLVGLLIDLIKRFTKS